MSDCIEVGFPISATAAATTAAGTAFVIAVGGGGASKTGVKNGYVICKASSDGLEEIFRSTDAPDQLLCAGGCTGETDNCVYFAFGCRHKCEIVRVIVNEDGSCRVASVIRFDAFSEREMSEEDDFNPHEVTAVNLMLNVEKGRYATCIVGNSSGSVAMWSIGLASGSATSIGALPCSGEGEEAAEEPQVENKVKCISRYGNAVVAVTLGDGLCRVWDCAERTLKHTLHASDFGLDKESRPLMRFCSLTHDGKYITVAAASRNMKAKNAGCWIATKAIDSDEAPVVVRLKETKTLASCSILEREEDFVVALGNTDADALGFTVKDNSASCTCVKRSCHGFVATATNCIELADSKSILFISAGTDGTCRVHHPGKKSVTCGMKTVSLVAVTAAVVGIASAAYYKFML